MGTPKVLHVDEKWSIAYDPSANDRPLYWLRHGEELYDWDGDNAVTALFYALLAAQGEAT